MRATQRGLRPRPAVAPARLARRAVFAELWNNVDLDLEVLRQRLAFPTRNAVLGYAGHLRELGYVLVNRIPVAARRRQRPSRVGRSTEQVIAEDTILRSALIPSAIVYDGQGRVIGTMSALTREVSAV